VVRKTSDTPRKRPPVDAWEQLVTPLMALFDVLGKRWSLRILWELRNEPATFRDLRARCSGMSSSVLTTRLRDLRAHEMVDHTPGVGYSLTETGRGIARRVGDLYEWLGRQPSTKDRT
jgi:DNA-binding HxlR family transcriptional regulator